MKRLATVKLKQIISTNLISGEIKTRDVRFNNVDYKKFIKFLTKSNINFKVGFKCADIIKNCNYIEVYCGQFEHELHSDILDVIAKCKVRRK